MAHQRSVPTLREIQTVKSAAAYPLGGAILTRVCNMESGFNFFKVKLKDLKD